MSAAVIVKGGRRGEREDSERGIGAEEASSGVGAEKRNAAIPCEQRLGRSAGGSSHRGLHESQHVCTLPVDWPWSLFARSQWA